MHKKVVPPCVCLERASVQENLLSIAVRFVMACFRNNIRCTSTKVDDGVAPNLDSYNIVWQPPLSHSAMSGATRKYVPLSQLRPIVVGLTISITGELPRGGPSKQPFPQFVSNN